jgi:hypothetical protein
MARPAPETDLQNEGRLCIGSLPFVRLYRNNTGTLKDERGIPVSYGLAIGSADTIGLVAPHGRFLSIEWKRPGWTGPSGKSELERHEKQCAWRDQILRMGGVAGFAQSLEDGLRLTYLATLPYNVDPATDTVHEWVAYQAAAFRERMTERGKRKSNRDR